MTTHSVAAAPKEMTPRRPPVAMPDFGIDFAHMLGKGTSLSTSGTPAPSEAAVRQKAKSSSGDASAAAAAAAPVPTPSAPALQTITAATTAGVTQVAAPAPSPSALVAAAPTPPAVSGTPSADGPKGSATGRTAAAPAGAAEVNARVVAAAPNYLSQPNSALAGLWHHTGAEAETAPGAQPPSGTEAGPPAEATPASQPPPTQAPQGPPTAADLAAPAHAAPGIAVAAATLPGSTTASSSSDSDGSVPGAITVSLPTTGAQASPASPPGASPTLTVPTIMPAVEQVAINLKQAVQNGTNRIEIQLKPASLGAIDVKLDVTHDGRITAVISADRSDTLNLLRQDASGLQQALRDAGLQADSGSLSFNLRGDQQSFAQNSAPAAAPSARTATSAREPDATPAGQGHASRYRRHAGALNIEV